MMRDQLRNGVWVFAAAFASISFLHNRARAMGFACPNPGHHPDPPIWIFQRSAESDSAEVESWPASVNVAGWNPEQQFLIVSSGSVSEFQLLAEPKK